jgi:hypothetical protein
MLNGGSVTNLYGKMLRTGRAFDRALSRRDVCESTRLGDKYRAESRALDSAQPETLREASIVLHQAASSIAASDDPLADDLGPRLRQIARATRRGAACAADVAGLRAIARLAECVRDGAGLCVDLAPRILAAAACVGRPRLV